MAKFFSLKVKLSPEIDDVNRFELLETINVGSKLHRASSVGYEVDTSSSELQQVKVPIVSCDSFCLSPAPLVSYEHTSSRFVVVFCPSTLVDTAIEQVRRPNRSGDGNGEHPFQYSTVEWIDNPTMLSEVLLSLVHPFLSQNFTIQAILTSMCDYQNAKQSTKSQTGVSLVVLNLTHCPYASIIDDLLDATNCDVIRSGPEVILKVLLLCNLEFHASHDVVNDNSSEISSNETPMNDTVIEIPTCAVCLHRIEPSRLGLPRPRSHQLCSKFCQRINKDCDFSCPRQRLLHPWPHPCYCEACHVIWNYWKKSDIFPSVVDVLGDDSNYGNVSCTDCGMRETLWVCLTCGFVGCGRYSNKHASEHNDKTHHPFCLELSTLRIWSYVDSEYVHRLDSLECPSSLQNRPVQLSNDYLSAAFTSSGTAVGTAYSQVTLRDQSEVGDDSFVYSKNAIVSSSGIHSDPAVLRQHSAENYDRIISSSFASVDEKTPKKATMIGEEYEVLLQSALEEQAQFYEGEISWLRATLTAQHVDRKSITEEEALEIDTLGAQINALRKDIDHAGHRLLEIQSSEAGHRATSQRLLREQTVIQDLLKKIREETSMEHSRGQEQMDELELQIADLNTNQRMMEQFSQDSSLKNSQIFAAEQQASPSLKSTKKGKKFRRFFQK